MKLGLEKNSHKPALQTAEDSLFQFVDLLLGNLTGNQLEQTLFVGALTCKQCQSSMYGADLAMLMESDIEFTNSDEGTQIAFSPKHGDCQRNKCMAHVAINLILVLLRLCL